MKLSRSHVALRSHTCGWLLPLIVVYALVNGFLYALLLPLWEGFDEPFHYAYVQTLSLTGRLPVIGESSMSREVWESLTLVPASHIVERNIPGLVTFDAYFQWPQEQRREQRRKLAAIPRNTPQELHTEHENYQAHHPPLAYAALAIPDRLLSGQPLLTRVRALRLLCVVLSVILTAMAAVALCGCLGVYAPFRELVVLLVFSSQMFYASTAHICNDWLAIPLASWLVVAGIRAYETPSRLRIGLLAAVLGLGLLTKAYFLALAPTFLTVMIVAVIRRRAPLDNAAIGILITASMAAPWYGRNLWLYGSLSAMPENVAGIGFPQVLAAAWSVPWHNSAGYMARASLWTGNNHFTTFSRATLNAMLALLAVGVVSDCWSLRKRLRAADVISGAAILAFVLAVAYSTIVSYLYTKGASAGASPWYMQVLLVPVLACAMRGFSRSGLAGRILACASAVLWSYVMLATYAIKLLPLYAGYPPERRSIGGIAAWYWNGSASRSDFLVSTALAPPLVLYTGIVVVSTLGLFLCVRVCRTGAQYVYESS